MITASLCTIPGDSDLLEHRQQSESPVVKRVENPLQVSNVQRASHSCCYQIDPTRDPRWAELLARHPKASVFHSAGWLQALKSTYGYEPVVFTTSSPTEELKNGLVFCRVDSWLTRRRLVSLPFSDHCDPLCNSDEELDSLIRYLQTVLKSQNLTYLELRPAESNFSQSGDNYGFLPVATYFLHTLSLSPDLHELLRGFDADCVRRRIRRAEKACLEERCGRSEELLRDFFELFTLTRGRHHLPPIPYVWFLNLIQHQGDALEIRLAYRNKTPISAILTLRFKDTVHYKYGCSDARFNNLGATPWLLWRAIVAAKTNGATTFDLGRTEVDNLGLLNFKNHWAACPKQSIYWRYPKGSSLVSAGGWRLKMAKQVFSFIPNKLLKIVGQLLYRHIG